MLPPCWPVCWPAPRCVGSQSPVSGTLLVAHGKRGARVPRMAASGAGCVSRGHVVRACHFPADAHARARSRAALQPGRCVKLGARMGFDRMHRSGAVAAVRTAWGLGISSSPVLTYMGRYSRRHGTSQRGSTSHPFGAGAASTEPTRHPAQGRQKVFWEPRFCRGVSTKSGSTITPVLANGAAHLTSSAL